MRHLLQWFCGYIQLCLRGRQINRFLNLCSYNGIHLWNISYDLERKVRAHIRLKDFYLLKPYLKKTKTRLRIVKKIGFPFWCYKHPRLKWMLLTTFIGICLSFYSLSFVWTIQISGNEKVTTHELRQYLEENQITIGSKCKQIDCAAVEYILRKEFQQIGWVSVYLDHTSLCIDIKESLYEEFKDYPVDDGRAYHLMANKDATIDSIITQAGTPIVNAGMQVKKGDVLVLGECEIFDDIGEVKEILNVQAQALVYGDVSYEFYVPFTEMEIFALRLADTYNEKTLDFISNQKTSQFIEKLEQNGVIILGKNVMIDKKDQMIVFICSLEAREQIGINIPAEEVWEYESE